MVDRKYMYMRRMSPLFETASIQCRFCFILIGPGAHAIGAAVARAELHTEILELLGGEEALANGGPPSPNGTPPTSPQERPVLPGDVVSGADDEECDGGTPQANPQFGRAPGSRGAAIAAAAVLHHHHRGTYCVVDEEEHVLARIRFHSVENFRESLPHSYLADATAVRNTCFFFLVDGRLDYQQEVATTLNHGFDEMQFHYNQVKAQLKPGSTPELRTLLLHHGSGTETYYRHKDRELRPFTSRLAGLSRSTVLRTRQVTVDFENSDDLYGCLREIAVDLYRGNKRETGSFGTVDCAQPKARICTLQ